MPNNDYLEALHNATPKHLEYLDALMANKDRLNVAACYGCGKVYTRDQMAYQLKGWHEFECTNVDCEYEYNAPNRRPLTFWEIIALDKQTGDQHNGVNVAAVVRALYEVLYG